MSSSSFATIFAQVTNAAGTATTAAPDASQQGAPIWTTFVPFVLVFGVIYFLMIRPQMQATKKKDETVKGAKTGDKIVTSSGIHGVITNVKDSTVIVRVADNVKLEIEKSHIEKITRPDAEAEKSVAAKVS